MIKCAILDCSNRKDREKDYQYYRLPAIVKIKVKSVKNCRSSGDVNGWQTLTNVLKTKTWITLEYVPIILSVVCTS